MQKLTRRTILVSVVILIGLGIVLGRGSSPLPPTVYGPNAARFVVSFDAKPQARPLSDVYNPNPPALPLLLVASLGANTYESVLVDKCADEQTHCHLSPGTGFHLIHWHQLPAAVQNVACRVGDTTAPCPGRIAALWILDHGVIYELSADQVAQSEVQRFFASFHPGESQELNSLG